MAGEIIGDGVLEIDADLRKVDKQMAQLAAKAIKGEQAVQREREKADRAAEKAAEKQRKAAERAAREASVAAKNAANAMKANLNKVTSASAALSAALGGVGGRFGALANSVVRPLAEVGGSLGVVGVAAGGAALAIAGVGVAIGGAIAVGVKFVGLVHDLGDASVAAAERMRAAGLAAEIPAEAIRSIAEYKAGQQQLNTSTDELLVSGHKAAAIVGIVSLELAKAENAFRESDKSAGEWLVTLNDINTLGARHIWQPYVDDIVRTDVATLDTLADTQKLLDALKKASEHAASLNNIPLGGFVGPTQDMVTPTLAEKDAAVAKSVAVSEAESLRIRTELLGINDQAQEDDKAREEGLKRFIAGQHALQDANEEMGKAAIDIHTQVDAAVTKADAATADYAGSWDQFTGSISAWFEDANVQASIEAFRDILTGVSDMFGMVGDAAERSADRINDSMEDTASTTKDVSDEIAQLHADNRDAEHQYEIDRNNARIADLELEQTALNAKLIADKAARDEMAKRAKKAFIAHKAAAISEAIIGAALSIIQCFSQLGPIAGAVAAAAVGITTGVEIANIAAEPVPEFPTGMSPDHFSIGVQRREAVLSQRGVAAVESTLGRGSVDRLNAGDTSSGGDNVIMIGRRVLARISKEGRQRVADPRAGKRRRRG